MKELSFENALVATLSYFDIFGHALTAQELYQNMWKYPVESLSFFEFEQKLALAVENEICSEKNCFFYLPETKDSLSKRESSTKYVEQKLYRARFAFFCIAAMPFVRGLFVCNTVGGGWPSKTSDIDVLIIVKGGHIWFTRLIVTAVVALTGLRRGKKQIENRVCLSFYLNDRALDLSVISLNESDIYLQYWFKHLIPIYDQDQFYMKLQDNNMWSQSSFLNQKNKFGICSRLKIILFLPVKQLKNLFEFFFSEYEFNSLEIYARFIQQARMRLNKRSVQFAKDSRVVINDDMLKFHENDRRNIFRDQWLARCARYGIDPI